MRNTDCGAMLKKRIRARWRTALVASTSVHAPSVRLSICRQLCPLPCCCRLRAWHPRIVRVLHVRQECRRRELRRGDAYGGSSCALLLRVEGAGHDAADETADETAEGLAEVALAFEGGRGGNKVGEAARELAAELAQERAGARAPPPV